MHSYGRVSYINFQLQAPRVRLRPDEARVPERERVAGLEARGQTVHQIQGLLPEELRLDASQQDREQLVGVPISSFPAPLLLVRRRRLDALAARAAP